MFSYTHLSMCFIISRRSISNTVSLSVGATLCPSPLSAPWTLSTLRLPSELLLALKPSPPLMTADACPPVGDRLLCASCGESSTSSEAGVSGMSALANGDEAWLRSNFAPAPSNVFADTSLLPPLAA